MILSDHNNKTKTSQYANAEFNSHMAVCMEFRIVKHPA